MRKAFLFAFLVAAASTTSTRTIANAREEDFEAHGASDGRTSAFNGILWSDK